MLCLWKTPCPMLKYAAVASVRGCIIPASTPISPLTNWLTFSTIVNLKWSSPALPNYLSSRRPWRNAPTSGAAISSTATPLETNIVTTPTPLLICHQRLLVTNFWALACCTRQGRRDSQKALFGRYPKASLTNCCRFTISCWVCGSIART